MKQVKAASPPPVLLDSRRARLRGRPSGLKGRGRDRYATDLRSALDPGASTAPDPAAVRGSATALPRQARGATRSDPYKSSLYGFRGLPRDRRRPLHAIS